MKWPPRMTGNGVSDGPIHYQSKLAQDVIDNLRARIRASHRGGRRRGSVPWNKYKAETMHGKRVLLQSSALAEIKVSGKQSHE